MNPSIPGPNPIQISVPCNVSCDVVNGQIVIEIALFHGLSVQRAALPLEVAEQHHRMLGEKIERLKQEGARKPILVPQGPMRPIRDELRRITDCMDG